MDCYGTSVGDLKSVRINGGFTLTGVTLMRFHGISSSFFSTHPQFNLRQEF